MGREPGGGVGKIIFEENVCVAWYDIKTCPGVVRETNKPDCRVTVHRVKILDLDASARKSMFIKNQ